ncbi:MAG: hemerythrin family protein [Bryobacterales bacterium]|nr:hemerythrin family protein [Bryobacterales bacterium]
MARRAHQFSWKSAYDTGVAGIDQQHHKIVASINSIHRAIARGADQPTLLSLMDDFIGETVQHFTDEEALMKSAGYGQMAPHRLDHTLLRTRIQNFRRAAESERHSDPGELLAYAEDWLDRHFLGADKTFAGYLHSRQ